MSTRSTKGFASEPAVLTVTTLRRPFFFGRRSSEYVRPSMSRERAAAVRGRASVGSVALGVEGPLRGRLGIFEGMESPQRPSRVTLLDVGLVRGAARRSAALRQSIVCHHG